MAITFKAKVVGDIPARRLIVLAGRDEEGVIKISIADRTSAVDFVSTRALSDGEITEVTLKEGLQVWHVEAATDLQAGQWVACGPDGKATQRQGVTLETVGYTLEPAKAGEIAKVLRRESFEGMWGLEVQEKLDDLESRVTALEGGNGA